MTDLASGMTDVITGPKPSITIHDRLEAGNFSVDEVLVLKRRSRSGFYADVKAGLVEIRKQGRNTVIPGPSVRKYLGLSA
jgi:hypothetical protein